MKKILCGSIPGIEELLQHSRYLAYLSKRVLTYLPVEFNDKVSVLKYDRQVLVLSAASSGWAGKLRFYLPELKQRLSGEQLFLQLRTIKVKVCSADVSKKTKKNPNYSTKASLIIEQSVQQISDQPLKSSLLKLSRHIAGKNKP